MTTDKKPMDTFTACSICEGFCGGENATEEERIEAWQYLIDTGQCWTLQGWYGRTAMGLIEAGICTPAPDKSSIAALAA
jgi:hypothetical protein